MNKVTTRGALHYVPLRTGGAQILFGTGKSPSSWSLLEFHADTKSGWDRFRWLTDDSVRPLERNPARPAAKHRRAARAMVKRYGKRRARKVAGGMIGTTRGKQREHFVKTRKAINPKRRNPVRITSPRAGSRRQFRVYTRKLRGPWALTVKTNSVKHALDSAGKLEQRGYRVRVTQVR